MRISPYSLRRRRLPADRLLHSRHCGTKVYGAYSWLKLGPIGFEPAEFAKLAFILGLAWFLRVRENQIQSFSTVLMALAFTAVPFVLS